MPLLYGGSQLKTAERHKRAHGHADSSSDLGNRADHHPNQLSGGQQQRVAIARALINNPSILLADEPTGNLDTQTSIEVMGIFQRLNQERGITVLLITHEMDIAEYGTRIVTFRDGLVVADRAVARRRVAKDELAALPQPPRQFKEASHVGLHDLSHRAQGAGSQQDAHGADHARHDHRRRRCHHHGRARHGRPDLHRGQIQSAGTNMVMVSAGNFSSGGVRQGQGNASTLVPDDAVAIARVQGVQYQAAGVNTRGQIVSGNQNWGTQIQGTDVDLTLIRSGRRTMGAFFTPQDVTTASKVAVLGSVVRDQLFGPDQNPVGQIVRINNQPFSIVGVMSSKGQSGMGQDQDDVVFVPYTTVMKKMRGITYIQKVHRVGCRIGDGHDGDRRSHRHAVTYAP